MLIRALISFLEVYKFKYMNTLASRQRNKIDLITDSLINYAENDLLQQNSTPSWGWGMVVAQELQTGELLKCS